MSTSHREKRRLGEILVEQGVLDARQLQSAFAAQGRYLLPLGSTLLQLGLATEVQIAEALAEQYGVPGIRLSTSTIPTAPLALIPQEVAAAHRVLPVHVAGGVITLALSNPGNSALLDEVAFASGKTALPVVAPRSALDEAIRSAYAARSRGEPVWRGAESVSAEPKLDLVQPVRAEKPQADVQPTAEVKAAAMEPELGSSALEAFGPAPSPPAPPRAPGAKPLVLAVDDEPEILDLIEKALTHRGMEVIRAARGREALEVLRGAMPDVVLLDAMLPEIHGFEICSQIKRSPQYQHIPVIMISAIYTGWNFIEDVKRIYLADDYITKPFRVMELVHRVEDALGKAQGRPHSPEVAEASKKASVELRQAAEALRSGQLEETLDAAQRAVLADPFDPRAHFLLGTALQRAGRIYEAISEYERVVELAPTQFSALKNLAVLYERQGFRAKAVEMWTRALGQSPSEPVRQTIKAHLIGLL
jgi:DNA-binding response OmpR family regulator